MIFEDGWKAEVYRILVENKKGAKVDKGWACDLVPSYLIINHYFPEKKNEIEELRTKCEILSAQLEELEEEHNGEEGYFADMEKVNKVIVQNRLKEILSKKNTTAQITVSGNLAAEDEASYNSKTERQVLKEYLSLSDDIAKLNANIKDATLQLDKQVLAKYNDLKEADIKQLVIEDKWMATIERTFNEEMERVSQTLTQRIKELAERYETTLPRINEEVAALEEKVNAHLLNMGFEWN